jgi:acyl carrier protein
MANRLTLAQIEVRVCDVAAEQQRLPRSSVHPGLRLIQDLHCDSLDFLELIMAIEAAFNVPLDVGPDETALKAVFTRDPFRLSDLAEMVYVQQGCSQSRRGRRTTASTVSPPPSIVQFTQLDGTASPDAMRLGPLYEPFGANRQGFPLYRRRTDGMVCVSVPGGEALIGTDAPDTPADALPAHRVRLDGFLIDREPVSTTAWCRFLNSIDPVSNSVLQDWFVLTPDDKRQQHMIVAQQRSGWAPLPAMELKPMMLVSWYGANAYSLWANRRDWQCYRGDDVDAPSHLPTEAQWEYAARGGDGRRFPWGDDEPTSEKLQFARHERGRTYTPQTLPLADVTATLGMSRFGLHHMAGNVWQWCRDWYLDGFYQTAQASIPNAVNRQPSSIRSERGGSWIGNASLCRSSYRRGRIPSARGRCLGFRCVGDVRDLSSAGQGTEHRKSVD